ncbi:MAG: MaoC family dehydratase N-terminal domain-containing protein [Rhodospirillales bacterium]|nr:MaoC family dehydratase N-terminal domain-containing protein [Rhodospirillales bacterium]QQS11597.1 MAG: MaoC family dehydratase N-terminal domain-containing protein [Rhodospirillales bacterium]
MTDDALAHYRTWIGRTQSQDDLATAYPARALAATLDLDESPPAAGDEVPPYWHMLYFLEAAPASRIGADGHPQRGGFLPPVALPRRMYAGTRLEFGRPLRIGERIRRESTIKSVEGKTGASGDMVFVTIRHVVSGEDGPALIEEQDVVYREAPAAGAKPAAPKPAPVDATWRRVVTPDPVMLFRLSALLFVGHRIHYDLPYVTGVEGYPGLLVHGPLMGLLQLELARRSNPSKRVARYDFRALSPVFHTAPFSVAARAEADGTVTTWIANGAGGLAQQGKVAFAA